MASSHRTFISASPSSSYEEALERTATLFGIQSQYWDIWGREHHPGPDVQRAILEALEVPIGAPQELDHAARQRILSTDLSFLPVCAVIGAEDPVVPVCIERWNGEPPRLNLTLEDGSRMECPAAVSRSEEIEFEGTIYTRLWLRLPQDLPYGYHRLAVQADSQNGETALIYCPARAPQLPPEQRTSGIAISLYGLRSMRNWGVGDTTDLKEFATWAHREAGASFVALNPLHAIGNRRPYNASPYLPNCSFYRNYLYIDVERAPGFSANVACREMLERRRAEIEALRDTPFVEYETVAPLKLRFLKQAYREFRRTGNRESFDRYCKAEGDLLRRYAIYCALDEVLHKRNPELWIWPDWPAEYRDPESEAVRQFESEHPRLVEFYCWLAWVVDEQLAEAQDHAKRIGMSIGLYHDLALATDRCGSDLWAHRPYYVHGCRVGAPPDDFSPQGQDWSFPPPNALRHQQDGYRLFAAAIRNNCRHGGALRMDHVMRFFRLYWIPEGMDATRGTYVKEKWQDLLRIIALEAHRAGVIVIGEDLGTVEDYIRDALSNFGIFSYRLLYFERWGDGQFRGPGEYPPLAIVSSTTHDLPTLAGFWQGRDIEARRAADLVDESGYRAQWENRNADKQKLLQTMHGHGLLPPNYPNDIRHVPELSDELHRAVNMFLAITPSKLFILNQEDLTKEREQQNLPGSTGQHPNWQRKMSVTIEDLTATPRVRHFTAMYRDCLREAGRLR